MLPLPPISTLFPYTTLFRSRRVLIFWLLWSITSWWSRYTENSETKISLSKIKQTIRRSEEHTSELQSLRHLVCRLLLEKKKKTKEINETNQHKTNSMN